MTTTDLLALLTDAAQNALDLLEDLHPVLHPNETTQEMAIWVACEKLRAALAAGEDDIELVGDGTGTYIAQEPA